MAIKLTMIHVLEEEIETDIKTGIVGPGGQDILLGPAGDIWILFHGWAPDGYRRLYLALLYLENEAPFVGITGKDLLPIP